MTDNRPIFFIDSGIGGLPYLQWVFNKLPLETFLYLADTANFPYGEKSVFIVKNILVSTVENIILKFNPKLIVIACNTATVVALSTLRAKFSIPFVGVVPAVKPAAEQSVFKKIGLLATNRTVSEPYTQTLINNFALNCEVINYADAKIIDFIENKFFNSTEREKQEILSEPVKVFNDAGIDYLIMGCTHFIYIEEHLKNAISSTVKIINSIEGVGKQIIRTLESKNIYSGRKIIDHLYVSKELPESRYKKFALQFNLTYKGKI